MKAAELKQKLEDQAAQYRKNMVETAELWMGEWIDEEKALQKLEELKSKIDAIEMILKILMMGGDA